MRAAVVAIGSELLGVDRLDTNSLFLAASFERYGFHLVRKVVLGDVIDQIAAEMRRLVAEVDVAVVTGGLGPTADDVTREGVAAAFDRSVAIDEAMLARIEERFRRLGVRMAAVNRKQAGRIEGAQWLPNAHGSAPGMLLTVGHCGVFLLPGVPRELEAMTREHLEPWLEARAEGEATERRTFKVACVPESRLEERIAPLYPEFGREAITVLARPAEILVRAFATGAPELRRERLDAIQAGLLELVGDTVFAVGDEPTLESVVGGLLTERGETVATSESCTGGLVAQRLTGVAGSSAYFLGGFVAYSNAAKRELVGVPEELLAAHGAVSAPVAEALAIGACDRLGADWGIGVTGIAGPGGGSAEKPVGTVHIAVTRAGGEEVVAIVRRFPGDRERVRLQSAQWALDLLRRRLAGLAETA